MKINLKWRSPLYTSVCDYKTKKLTQHVIEPCKKQMLLEICIKGVSEDTAKELLNKIITLLGSSCEDLLLSNKAWGIAAEYDLWTGSYQDALCYAKDFDNLELQKKAIMKEVRDVATMVKREYLSFYPDNCYCELAV